jgi:hypothetical protein
MEAKQRNGKKRAYLKPELRTVDLAAEEVLGFGCKTAGYVGPTVVGAATCETNVACAGMGT